MKFTQKMAFKVDTERVSRGHVIIAVLVAFFCFIYFYPYVSNHNYIVAAAHADDDFYAYNNVINNISFFQKDIFHLLVPCFVNGTLLNWGALWLVNKAGIPIAAVSLSLEAFMFFALPLCYVFLLRKNVDKIWLPIIFLVSLLAHHYAWNLTNHGMVDLPYRPHIAIPILFYGMLLVLTHRKLGYVVMAFGVLFHAPMGIYACATITFWQAITFRKQVLRHIPLIIPIILAVIIPSYIVLSQDYPRVSETDMLKLYRFNMHFLPWESPFRWQGSITASAALLLFFILSRHHAKILGEGYGRLVISSFLSTVLLSASHLIGIAFDLPFLINLCGLRSLTLFAVILLPVIMLYIIDTVHNNETPTAILACFMLLVMVIGRPYGFYLFPISLLLIIDTSKPFPISRISGAAWLAISGFMIWLVGWLIFRKSPSAWIIDLLLSHEDKISENSLLLLLRDSAPAVPPAIVALLGFSMVLMVIAVKWISGKNKVILPHKVYSYVLTLLITVFLVMSSYHFYKNSGNQAFVDLYEAQLWAKINTKSDDLFIVYYGSWRSFSERPAFTPAILGYYMYLPDRRIKDFDDKVFEFYGMNDPYSHYNQKTLMREISNKYNSLNENDFGRLARYIEANYLVEKRKLNLPIAYRNSTYYVYKLM